GPSGGRRFRRRWGQSGRRPGAKPGSILCASEAGYRAGTAGACARGTAGLLHRCTYGAAAGALVRRCHHGAGAAWSGQARHELRAGWTQTVVRRGAGAAASALREVRIGTRGTLPGHLSGRAAKEHPGSTAEAEVSLLPGYSQSAILSARAFSLAGGA